MIPSIGRIVLYMNLGGEQQAAIVTKVRRQPGSHGHNIGAQCVEDCYEVSLRVFSEQSSMSDYSLQKIPFSSTTEARDCWTWPPRVA